MKALNHNCPCGGQLMQLDKSGGSVTACCLACRHCCLIVHQPRFGALIPLRDFHIKRGDGPSKRAFDDVAMARSMVDCLVLDRWPSPATTIDYGIQSQEHLGALQHAVLAGVTAYDLDRVMGDGPAITRLVRSIPDQPYAHVKFDTAYDSYNWEEETVDEI